MKTKIVPVILLCFAALGCEDMLNDKNGKTEAELRAERNRPIYEQFIGEWDEYLDDEFLIRIGSSASGILVTNNDFTIKNDSSSYKTDIDYADVIYTLEEFKAVVQDYDDGVDSDDLTKDGFIKLEWYYTDVFEFFKYHFYDESKFSLKLVTRHPWNMDLPIGEREKQQISTDGGTMYCKNKNSIDSPGDSVDLPGGYGLTVGTYACTLTFNGDGTYVFVRPVGSDVSGTWTQDGGDLTMTYAVPGSQTISEVFTATEEDGVVTLTLKDESASISNILASFSLMAKSVVLTRN
jgi:hypothetical protein